MSGATTSRTEIDRDIVDSLIGEKGHDIADSFAESPINIGFRLISSHL